MNWHLLALIPAIFGSVAQLYGVDGAFILGAVGTMGGIAISCIVMIAQAVGFAAFVGTIALLTLLIMGGTDAMRNTEPQDLASQNAPQA